MAQAITLTDQKIALLLERVANRPHAQRNSLMLKLLHGSGLRVGELAALRVLDVVNIDGSIRDQILLKSEQTKGNRGRVAWLNEKLRSESET